MAVCTNGDIITANDYAVNNENLRVENLFLGSETSSIRSQNRAQQTERYENMLRSLLFLIWYFTLSGAKGPLRYVFGYRYRNHTAYYSRTIHSGLNMHSPHL